MRRVREILRLKHACGASDRAIARSLGVARSTVALTLERLAAAGLAWPLPETLRSACWRRALCRHGQQAGLPAEDGTD
jgi:DNA-binding IclR family transcriptional regulator